MVAYIKSQATFRTIAQRNTLDYKLTLDSLSSEASSIILSGTDFPGTMVGNWLVLNSIPMRIDTVTPGKGRTSFKCTSADSIFNRMLLYDANHGQSTVGAYIESLITSEWINQTDGAFATPYISVLNQDNTAFAAPEIDENGLFNFYDYIRVMRLRHNVTLQFSVEFDTLQITIVKVISKTHALVLDDGHTQLASSSFASSTVAKITVIQPVEVPQLDPDADPVFDMTETNWYLAKDGTASTTIPANRVDGDWITIVASETDIQSDLVQEEFAANGESHKVELFTDIEMAVNDRFRILLNGEVFEGTVVRKSRKNGDYRILYTSGELITTLQDRVHATAQAQQGGYTGDATGQMYAVGDIFITTRAGNPASLLGYGAWEQIQGRFLFAADSSHPAGSKGGSDSHTIVSEELPSAQAKVKTGSNGISVSYNGASGSARYTATLTTGDSGNVYADLGGQDQPFSIMPPYLTVYVWVRKE